jgi:hypothetical protein
MKLTTASLAAAFAALFVVSSSNGVDGFVLATPTNNNNHRQNGKTSCDSTTKLNLMDFLNEGKKKVVKSLAGDYDSSAIQARINGLINDNPVFMFSFTT